MKRSPMPPRRAPLAQRRAGADMIRTAGLAPLSPKRARQMREYSKARKAFLAVHPQCVMCWQPATDIHHRAGRDGDRLLDQSRWLPLCRADHQKVTVNPAWAITEGWSLPQVGAS